MTAVFFKSPTTLYLIEASRDLSAPETKALSWLLEAEPAEASGDPREFVGPRREIITPWSTNATDILANMGIPGITRIEMFEPIELRRSRAIDPKNPRDIFDPMLETSYHGVDGKSLAIEHEPAPTVSITDIASYNRQEGLALSPEEVRFLNSAASELGRPFTDVELYGFAQINSEHCRHKIFNGTFVIDGETKPASLFEMIKETSKRSPGEIVSAYRDNVAFFRGPEVEQFAPERADRPSFFGRRKIKTVLSLKAETHNFPTTVEPFYGASTGSGGEIRDRMAGGKGSIPLVGTAVYMTAYPRLAGGQAERSWEQKIPARRWKYQTPEEILIKASNGASDFGNKFGQPLVTGSLLTFEAKLPEVSYGYDRTIMLAGGVGFANAADAAKEEPKVGDKLVLLGGDNYRIGMAGGSVSSVDTGAYSEALELSAVQRANPEMQKRVNNVVRGLVEGEKNPIKSIHDHGAGGHINCLSELIDPAGGKIELSKLPIGDPTLTEKEIICNESQERMGLVASPADLPLIQAVAERERAPMHVIGEIDGHKALRFAAADGRNPVDLPLRVLFGASPKTVLEDRSMPLSLAPVGGEISSAEALTSAVEAVLALEGVACKDWLTNKVDRCVTGRVAVQQCAGPLHLPLNNTGVVALDFTGTDGIATGIGHAPGAGLIDPARGAILSLAEALTNLVWAPLENGLSSAVLSANWMWPAKQPGEDARLYAAVEAVSKFAIELGISIPTGKDSLSMTMKYKDGSVVRAPGTVIITAAGHCSDVRKTVTADLKPAAGSKLLYLDLSGVDGSPLGGSSYAQTRSELGDKAPTVADAAGFRAGFDAVQQLIKAGKVLAGHDIGSGGLIVTLAEMTFSGDVGIAVDAGALGVKAGSAEAIFHEKPGLVLQVGGADTAAAIAALEAAGCRPVEIGQITSANSVEIKFSDFKWSAKIADLRRSWFETSYLLDRKQSKNGRAKERFERLGQNRLEYKFPADFSGKLSQFGAGASPAAAKDRPIAAVIREQGTNGDREMGHCFDLAGFAAKDVTMSDLVGGREDLSEASLVVFPGGFANSDVLGAGRGWAGVFKHNRRAMEVLERFFARPDTLSLSVCNGCQLMISLGLLYPAHKKQAVMSHNRSEKFESCFVNVTVQPTNSVFLKNLVGSRLGVWVAHGEGNFVLPEGEAAYDVPLKYSYSFYPGNPNGSPFDAAAVSSQDGRHLAVMPHLERSLFPWNWPHYPLERWKSDEVSPWIAAFASARDWIKGAAK